MKQNHVQTAKYYLEPGNHILSLIDVPLRSDLYIPGYDAGGAELIQIVYLRLRSTLSQ